MLTDYVNTEHMKNANIDAICKKECILSFIYQVCSFSFLVEKKNLGHDLRPCKIFFQNSARFSSDESKNFAEKLIKNSSCVLSYSEEKEAEQS